MKVNQISKVAGLNNELKLTIKLNEVRGAAGHYIFLVARGDVKKLKNKKRQGKKKGLQTKIDQVFPFI